MNKGVLFALGAYLMWGFLPLYWKALQQAPATQILAHRIVWSLLFLSLLITLRRGWASIRTVFKEPKKWLLIGIAAALLTVNWLTYIWGVNAGYVVETSLGYFINPLVSVLMGVLFLREKLRPWQWVSVGLASLGVLYLTFAYGQLPWIALTLAFSFGFYGLIKKTTSLGALRGLTLEIMVMFLPALVFLVYVQNQGQGVFAEYGLQTDLLLVFTGVITALPLLLYGMAARLIDLSLLGILQYIAPTCQFLLGVLLYKEAFSTQRLVGFIAIWLALVIFSLESLLRRRNRLSSAPATEARS